MKTKFILCILLASSALFAGPRISIGVGIGVPAAPRYYVAPASVPAYVPPVPVAAPAYVVPGPGYSWVGGYCYFSGGRRLWRSGYWAAPRVPVYAGPRLALSPLIPTGEDLRDTGPLIRNSL